VIIVGGIILALFFLPGLVLEWLNLLHTAYYVTDDGVVIVQGAFIRRARRFKVRAGNAISRSDAKGGSIEFGDVEYEEIDAKGRVVRRESLPLRFRGLGKETASAFEAVVKSIPAQLRPSETEPPAA
jgi:hypothetical protein